MNTLATTHRLRAATLLFSFCLSGPALAQSYGPTPYLQLSDSPLLDRPHDYFHVETMEDGLINTPGLTVSGSIGGIFGPPTSWVDSVDEEDSPGSTLDGSGTDGFSLVFGDVLRMEFNAAALGGRLPTEFGIVWTDGNSAEHFLRLYDADGNVLTTVSGLFSNEGGFIGSSSEDRFIGYRGLLPIAAAEFWSGGDDTPGIEVDHIQYGIATRFDLPEASTVALPGFLVAATAIHFHRKYRKSTVPASSGCSPSHA